MSQSLWEEFQLEDKIFQILDVESHNPDHPLWATLPNAVSNSHFI